MLVEDQQRVPCRQLLREDLRQSAEVGGVQPPAWFLQHQQHIAPAQFGEGPGQVESQGLARRQLPARLPQPQGPQPQVKRPLQPPLHPPLSLEEGEGVPQREVEHTRNGLAPPADLEHWGPKPLASAFRADTFQVGQKLQIDRLHAQPATAFAASGPARRESKVAGREVTLLGEAGLGKQAADLGEDSQHAPHQRSPHAARSLLPYPPPLEWRLTTARVGDLFSRERLVEAPQPQGTSGGGGQPLHEGQPPQGKFRGPRAEIRKLE